MTRKGEITRADLMRKWPHHVALAADKVRGANTATVYGYAETLTDAPRPYHLRRGGDDLVVFCFAKPEDAEAFRDRFDGERQPGSQR